MLFNEFGQNGEILLAVKNLTFPVKDIFLKVIGGGFGNAEILHAVGDLNTHLLADPEEMIHGILGVEDNSGIVKDIYPVFPEFPCRHTFDLDKSPEIDIDAVFFRNFGIG